MQSVAEFSVKCTSAISVCLVLATAAPLQLVPSPPRGSDTGTLIARWSVGGQQTSDACAQVRAATIEIDIYDQDGSKVASLSPPCTAFMAAAVLHPGRYEVVAVPEDDRGHLASLPMVHKVAVDVGEERTVSFEFLSSALTTKRDPAGRRGRGTEGTQHR